MPAAGRPESATVPRAVARLAAGRPTRAVWRNELGGLTFAVGAADEPEAYVKWSPPGAPELAPEVERLRWARAHATVPEVLDTGYDDEGRWLLTAALPGLSAVDPRWLADPRTTGRAGRNRCSPPTAWAPDPERTAYYRLLWELGP